jgi:hypothetical protein
VQLWQTTHEFVLRTYQLEYHHYPVGEREKKMVTVETLSSFEPDSLGVIDVGSGRLGMRWLRDFHPVEWLRVNADNQEDFRDEIRFQMPNEAQPTRIVPRIVVGAYAPVPPPDAMLPELRARMTA